MSRSGYSEDLDQWAQLAAVLEEGGNDDAG